MPTKASHRAKFIAHPERYAAAQKPPPQAPPPRCAVFGGPHSGAAQLAAELAKKLGAVLVTPADAVAAAVAGGSALGAEVDAALSDGGTLPAPLCAAALLLRVSAADAVGNGFVVGGAPATAELAVALEAALDGAGYELHRAFH